MNNFGALLALIKQQQEQQGQPMMGPDAARAGGSGATFGQGQPMMGPDAARAGGSGATFGQGPLAMVATRPFGPPTETTHNFNVTPGYLKPFTEPSKVFSDFLLGAMGRDQDRVGSTFWPNEQVPLEKLQRIQLAARERNRNSRTRIGADMEVIGEKEGIGIFAKTPEATPPPAPEPADGVPYYLERPPRSQTAGPGQGAGFGQNVPATKALEAEEGVPYYLERPVDQEAELEKERRLQTMLNGIARGGSAFGDNFISPSMIMSGLSPKGSDPSYFASGEEALDDLSDENDWRSELSKTAREQLSQFGLEVPEKTSYRAAAQLFGPQLAKAQLDFDTAQAVLKQQQKALEDAKLTPKQEQNLDDMMSLKIQLEDVTEKFAGVDIGPYVNKLDWLSPYLGLENAIGTSDRRAFRASTIAVAKAMSRALDGAKSSDNDFKAAFEQLMDSTDRKEAFLKKFGSVVQKFKKNAKKYLLRLSKAGKDISSFLDEDSGFGAFLSNDTTDRELAIDDELGRSLGQ